MSWFMREISVLQEAIRLAPQLRPQMIVMAMAMPGLDGVQATREVVKHEPDTTVPILSMYSEGNYVRNALDAGARLYAEGRPGRGAGAVNALAAGKQVIGPGLLAASPAPDPQHDRLRPAKSRSWKWLHRENRIRRSQLCCI